MLGKPQQSVRESHYWQTKAGLYEQRVHVIWRPYHRFIETVIDLKRKTVLDFGCGIESPVAKRFERANGDLDGYFAYDLDADAIAKWTNLGKYYDFFGNDALAAQLDVVYADNTYEHLTLQQREDFVLRSRFMLRPGGTLVLVYPHVCNMNLIEHFQDRTHQIVAREHEAVFISALGFRSQLFICGLTFPAKPIMFSIAQFLRNVLLGYYPQTTVILKATKIA